jgi:hypothetical protein
MQRRYEMRMWEMGDVCVVLAHKLHTMGSEQENYYYMRENLKENSK